MKSPSHGQAVYQDFLLATRHFILRKSIDRYWRQWNYEPSVTRPPLTCTRTVMNKKWFTILRSSTSHHPPGWFRGSQRWLWPRRCGSSLAECRGLELISGRRHRASGSGQRGRSERKTTFAWSTSSSSQGTWGTWPTRAYWAGFTPGSSARHPFFIQHTVRDSPPRGAWLRNSSDEGR